MSQISSGDAASRDAPSIDAPSFDASFDSGFDASVVFQRPDATCFVQPGITFAKNVTDKAQCLSDAEVRAITATVKARPTTPQVERALIEWQLARKDRDRMRVLHDHLQVPLAHLERSAFPDSAKATPMADLIV